MDIELQNIAIPRLGIYRNLLKSQEFINMEKFSDEFRHRNKELYRKYGKSWVLDPLHQWSRQWEYPFIYQSIKQHMAGRNNVKILDAGAGFTFFPYYLADTIPNITITCVDSDHRLAEMYSETNSLTRDDVTFIASDLRNIKTEDKTYDIVYCISVLEHTKNYDVILKELSRVAKDNALLLVTFDVALEGKSDIPINDAASLVNVIKYYFPDSNIDSSDVLGLRKVDDIVSTEYFIKNEKDLLPWRNPILNYVYDTLKGKYRKTLYKRITFINGLFSR